MSQIVYVPEIVEGRYVHFSYSGESCAIRDFIASGDRPCRDYKTSQVNRMIKDWIPADRIPITDVSFWVKRLTEVSRARLGGSRPTANSQIPAQIENTGQRSEVYASSSGTLEPNNFSTGKPRVIFYGERGIVNTLFIELAKNSDAFGDFIKMVKTCSGQGKDLSILLLVIFQSYLEIGVKTNLRVNIDKKNVYNIPEFFEFIKSLGWLNNKNFDVKLALVRDHSKGESYFFPEKILEILMQQYEKNPELEKHFGFSAFKQLRNIICILNGVENITPRFI